MDKKKIFFTLLLIIVCVFLFIRRFNPGESNISYDITTQVSNKNLEVSFSSNNIYVKGEDIPNAIIKVGNDVVVLNEDIIKTINVENKTSIMLFLPLDIQTVVFKGSGDIYLNNIEAEQVVISTSALELDDCKINNAQISAKESSISSSNFSTLYIKGSNKPISIINSSAKTIMAETISGDISVDAKALYIEASSDSGNIDVTVNQDSHIIALSESGIIEIEEDIDKQDSENSVLVKTNSGNISISGDNL